MEPARVESSCSIKELYSTFISLKAILFARRYLAFLGLFCYIFNQLARDIWKELFEGVLKFTGNPQSILLARSYCHGGGYNER
ncbi:MAG: hypothetical protein JXB10_04005, partial [Pirellulales bacterium]|nr:hypothetical protein [Pirellulales bacterium]